MTKSPRVSSDRWLSGGTRWLVPGSLQDGTNKGGGGVVSCGLRQGELKVGENGTKEGER